MLATFSVLTVLQTTGSRTAQVRKSSFAIIDAIHAAARAGGGANKSPTDQQLQAYRDFMLLQKGTGPSLLGLHTVGHAKE